MLSQQVHFLGGMDRKIVLNKLQSQLGRFQYLHTRNTRNSTKLGSRERFVRWKRETGMTSRSAAMSTSMSAIMSTTMSASMSATMFKEIVAVQTCQAVDFAHNEQITTFCLLLLIPRARASSLSSPHVLTITIIINSQVTVFIFSSNTFQERGARDCAGPE